jgi:shikimate dehydrogenase
LPLNNFQIGLIGYPLGHSKSPEIFNNFFSHENKHNWQYNLFPIKSISDIEYLLKSNNNLVGFNVTIPYKSAIIPYLTTISPEAKFIGAVNTVLIKKNNLSGENTDIFGFSKLLASVPLPTKNKALILGSGGASKAVQFVLKSMQIPFKIVSRAKSEDTINYDEANALLKSGYNLVLNTTPLGMSPNIHQYPALDYIAIGKNHICIDLVYNPVKTKFLQFAEEKGALIYNGTAMLQYQAEKAWELFKNHAATL